MSKQIWKYPLVIGNQNISLPSGHKPLCAQFQDETLCLWAEVDPNEARVWKHVMIVGTGHAFNPEGFDYVSSVQDGPYVWHVYIEAGFGGMQ